MVAPIALLLVCQLIGEAGARALALPVPGPVIGLALLFLIFLIRPKTAESVSPLAKVILSNLSLLFVPAGVGVMGNLDVLSTHWFAFAAILIVSTIAAMLVSALTFLTVQRIGKGRGDA